MAASTATPTQLGHSPCSPIDGLPRLNPPPLLVRSPSRSLLRPRAVQSKVISGAGATGAGGSKAGSGAGSGAWTAGGSGAGS